MIKLLAAPIRSIVRFPLFQLAIVVAVILFLQAADEKSARSLIFNGVDKLVESTVGLLSAAFNVKDGGEERCVGPWLSFWRLSFSWRVTRFGHSIACTVSLRP
jgi:hypothetical protein